jgi:hypothetical protein
MISRTAFNQLRHSWVLLFGTVLGLIITYLLPLFLLLTGKLTPVMIGVLVWLLISMAYFPTVQFYKLSVPWSLSLPLAACFYMAVTVHSALRYWRGQGGVWKERVQDARL